LWADLDVRHVEEDPGEMRSEVAAIHAALPGSGNVSLPELARRAGLRPAVAQAAVYRMMASGTAEILPRGALVDVKLRQGQLDSPSRREISSRLKARTGRGYDQLDEVKAYAELATCRREYLLRRFGDDEEVAPCGGCDVCLGETGKTGKTGGALSALPEPEHGSVRDVVESGSETDPELFERLRLWRSEQSSLQKVPAYVVLHNSHIEEISSRKPRTTHELGAIKGIGLRRAARYGEEILAIVRGEEPVAVGGVQEEDAVNQEVRGGEENEDAVEAAEHLRRAESLLGAGRGSEAVPELVRALEIGGEEARRKVDALLNSASANDEERSGREAER
jgi:hypothetical protein